MIEKTKYLSVVISMITLTTSIGIGADLPRSTPEAQGYGFFVFFISGFGPEKLNI